MKWIVEYSENQEFVKVISEGKFNVQDHLRMMEDILSQEYWCPGMSVLFDNRKVDYSDTNLRIIMKASGNQVINNNSIGNGKAALLMKSVADFGVGRQYEIVTDEKISANIHVFIDENQAVRWLST